MNEDVLFALERSRERLRWGWTQGVAARDRNGFQVSPSDHAAEFCLTASFADVTEGTVYTETLDSLYETLVSKLELETPAASPIAKAVELIHWNDAEERTQEEVLELLGETIRRLRSGEEKEAA